MPKLKVTTISYIDVPEEELEAYEATTIEEAAENYKKWVNDGDASLVELTENIDSFTIEGIEDGAE